MYKSVSVHHSQFSSRLNNFLTQRHRFLKYIHNKLLSEMIRRERGNYFYWCNIQEYLQNRFKGTLRGICVAVGEHL